jgi:hypothetical protein
MSKVNYPSLFQVNTRVWLTELSGQLDRAVTLDDLPDTELDRWVESGFDWIWLLSVWTTGENGRKVSRQNPEWRHEFEQTLPNLTEEDIGGSGFAIADYHVHPGLGGDAALKRLRKRLRDRGLRLMLDFVPNHMGPDHAWVHEHPEYFISGTEHDLIHHPSNYTRVNHSKGSAILAYGRDPYFSGWPDTLQLDYSNEATVHAMKQELIRIASQCDGVRCDMAMLILPDVFEKTWGRRAKSFWPEVIKAVREHEREFCFLAEVYWDMEWTLQQQGFDYTYDKRLYDRLREGNVLSIRGHFHAGLDYQDRLVRFLENHDESRAADIFSPDQQKAAAVITYLSPGLRFFHQGQFEGRMKRISPHLVRAPHEPLNTDLQEFYRDLLAVIRKSLFREGRWQILKCTPAWDGNGSCESFIVFRWGEPGGRSALVTINLAPHSSQCYVQLPFPEMSNQSMEFRDIMSVALFYRHGNELLTKGLYLDMPPWGYHIFEVSEAPTHFY